MNGQLFSAVRTLRPRQWIKNLLVVVAPFAAGHVTHGDVLKKATFAFLSFCFVSSAGYIFNDLRDIETDRRHPTKSKRPIAAGLISKQLAMVLLVVSLLIGALFAALLPVDFRFTVAGYLALTLSYSYWLKNQAVVELVVVAACFVLRAIGGATATDTPSSKWFLVVISFGSLVIVASKRFAESQNQSLINQRKVLAEYPPFFLQFVLTVAAGVTLTSYSLWAFSLNEAHPYSAISLMPLCVGVFRFIWLVSKGHGEIPEKMIMQDIILMGCAVATAILLALSVYQTG